MHRYQSIHKMQAEFKIVDLGLLINHFLFYSLVFRVATVVLLVYKYVYITCVIVYTFLFLLSFRNKNRTREYSS